MRLDKPCEDCGTMMHNVTQKRKYCDKCRIEKQKGYYEKCINLKRQKPEKKENKLAKTAQKARAKGLSYGKYVALYGG